MSGSVGVWSREVGLWLMGYSVEEVDMSAVYIILSIWTFELANAGFQLKTLRRWDVVAKGSDWLMLLYQKSGSRDTIYFCELMIRVNKLCRT